MIIRQIPVGSFGVFTYIVACSETRDAVIIDPAGESDKIAAILEQEGLRVRYILNTHGHADHVLGAETLRKRLSVPVCMHGDDEAFFSRVEVCGRIARELGLSCTVPVDKRLGDGDVLEVGSLEIKTIHTPGHTPGSVCYYAKGNLFTGDTLFVGAAGRTDMAGGSLDTLLESIEKKILVLPEDTVIWPGHDYGETPNSTLEREKAENIYITDFILDG